MKFKPNFMAGLWDCYESATFGTKLKIRFGQNQSFSRTVFFSRFSQFNRWKPRNLVGSVMWGIFHWSATCTFPNSLLYKIVFTTKIQLNRNVCVFHTPSKEIALKYIYTRRFHNKSPYFPIYNRTISVLLLLFMCCHLLLWHIWKNY